MKEKEKGKGADDRPRDLREIGELVTVKEAAEYARVSRNTIYKLINDGRLHAIRLRRAIRLNSDEVCSYLGL